MIKTIMILFATILVFFITVGGFFFFIFRGSSTSISELIFNDVSLIDSENKAIIVGDIAFSSAVSFYGYSYRIDEDVLIITIKSGLVNPAHRYSNFRIEIIDEQISSVKRVALENGDEFTTIFKRE